MADLALTAYITTEAEAQAVEERKEERSRAAEQASISETLASFPAPPQPDNPPPARLPPPQNDDVLLEDAPIGETGLLAGEEMADDEALVAEKIRLLQEENVRLRQSLGVAAGKAQQELLEEGEAAAEEAPKGAGTMVSDWLMAQAAAAEERERQIAEASAAMSARERLAAERAERQRLLQELDGWVARSKGRGAAKRDALRAAPLPDYGQDSLQKRRGDGGLSEGAARVMADLERQHRASAPRLASATPQEKEDAAAQRALADTLADIERALAASTNVIATHAAGGVAAPLVMRIGQYLERLSAPKRHALMLAGALAFMLLVILNLIYDADDQIDAALEEGGVVFDSRQMEVLVREVQEALASTSDETARRLLR